MYLVSIYFDENTNRILNHYIKTVAKHTGNFQMIKGEVPPHITLSAFDTKHEQDLLLVLEECVSKMKSGELQWVSVGSFLPYVLFVSPVLSEYLHGLSVEVNQGISKIQDARIRPCYQPFQWMPHATIGKKLSQSEMKIAFETMQHQFGVFKGTVTKIGLAKTNPYEDIRIWELQ